MRRQKSTQSFQDLLGRYKTILRAPQASIVKEVVAQYVALGIPCTDRDVSYSKGTRTVSIRANGPLKTEMLLRKSAVLTALSLSLSSRDVPKDII